MRLRIPFEVAGALLDLGFSKARNDTDQPERIEAGPPFSYVAGELTPSARRKLEQTMKNNAKEIARQWGGRGGGEAQ